MEEAIRVWEDIVDEVSGAAKLDIHVNLAVAYKYVNKLAETWHHLGLYLRNCDKDDEQVAEELRSTEQTLAKTHVKVAIACDPDGAKVYLTEEATGNSYGCPVTWWFKPGKHAIHVAKEGFEPKSEELDVRKWGGEGVHTVKLKAKEQYGFLVVEGSRTGVLVSLGGEPAGSVPFRRKLVAGTYDVMVEAPGETPWKKRVVVGPGRTAKEAPEIAQAGTAGTPGGGSAPTVAKPGAVQPESRTWKWALLGGGIAAMAAGGLFQYLGYAREAELHDRYPANGSLSEAEYQLNKEKYQDGFDQDVVPMRTMSYSLYAVGGVAAAAGATLLILDMTGADGDKSATSFEPMLISDGLGLSLEFGF